MLTLKKKDLILLLLSILCLLISCASPTTKRIDVSDVAAEIEAKKQRKIALEAIVKDKFRLVDVAYDIFLKSVPLCKDETTHSIGTLVASKYSVKEDMRDAAYSLYGISNVLKIIHVMRGSAAEKAGIKRDDVPLAINEWSVPIGEKSGEEFLETLEREAKDQSHLSLKIMRDGSEKTIEIAPDILCDYTIVLSNQDTVNAFADGKNVVITRGMMRFTESDIELALVVSHELAHNVMGHMRARRQNVFLGSVLDIVAAVLGVNTQGTFGSLGARAYSQEFEAEADYVGLYMMALAGLDFEKAPHFWRRMAAIHPGNIESNFTATHPATPHRFVALEKTVGEIKQKIMSGLSLTPEMKDDATGYNPPDVEEKQ